MSNMKPNRSQKDAEFVKRLDALIGAPDGRDNSALDEDLRECGIDPKQLREVAYERIRSIATQKFISLGKDCPPQMREALRQLRPPTPEEEELNRMRHTPYRCGPRPRRGPRMTPLQRFLWWLLGGTTYTRSELTPQPRIAPRRPI